MTKEKVRDFDKTWIRITPEVKKELQEVSELTGVPQNRIIQDGIVDRCKKLRGMFAEVETKE